MQIIGFTLTKILIERKEDLKGKWKVSSKIDVKDLKEEKITLEQGKDVLKANFEYAITYEPDLGDINFKGYVLILSEPKETKTLIAEWKNNKTIVADAKVRIFNTIFQKCNIKALELEDDFNLPPHIKLPAIKTEQPKSESSYTG